MSENTNDLDGLLQMVEELITEEFTPETISRMESVEVALSNFLEETSAALLEQEELMQGAPSKPPPPSIPPPGSLLEMEESVGQPPSWEHNRDLAADLAQTGRALELLRQRLQQEEEALLEAEQALQTTLEDQQYVQEQEFLQEPLYVQEQEFLDEQDILLQAEEALRKSREAAERRKIEAERRSVSAIRASTGYRRQQIQDHQQQIEEQQQLQKEQELQQQNFPTEDYGVFNEYEDNDTITRNPDDEDDFFPRTKKRPTIELESLLENFTKKRPTIELGSLFGNRLAGKERDSRAPAGVPILYNWVQNLDGSITGNVRESRNFRDGAQISTSRVSEEVRGGTTVATESGSQYFLEEQYDSVTQSSPMSKTTENSYTPQAPEGVPTVKSWEVRGDGVIIGLIYGSPDAEDGNYIETSPIVSGDIDNFSVVSTLSGSRYFLSGTPPEDSSDTMSLFRDKRPSNQRRQGTITLSKLGGRIDSDVSQPRSTFSLFDLFNGRETSTARAPSPLPPPSPDKVPPAGTPTLTGCVFNDDGTITGYVFGSSKIDDGLLITTSPIVYGERRQFETVTTVTGSLYFLG